MTTNETRTNIVDRYPDELVCDSTFSCSNSEHPRESEYDCSLPTDDGTMANNVQELRDAVVGRKIISAHRRRLTDDEINTLSRSHYWGSNEGLILELNNGHQVFMADTSDCCAHTELDRFIHNPQSVDHMILGVGTEDGYQKWHIYADFGDVLALDVSWSPGNPFYYGYGFNIQVFPITIDGEVIPERPALPGGSQK